MSDKNIDRARAMVRIVLRMFLRSKPCKSFARYLGVREPKCSCRACRGMYFVMGKIGARNEKPVQPKRPRGQSGDEQPVVARKRRGKRGTDANHMDDPTVRQRLPDLGDDSIGS